MLVLTRRVDESLILGRDGEIVVKVLGYRSGGVVLGIEAPLSVPIYREEVYEQMQSDRLVERLAEALAGQPIDTIARLSGS